MKKVTTKLNYKIYARKSSEADDKQVLSIESQIDELKKLAKERNIEITEEMIVHEAHSAKTAYTRVVFEQLMKDIESGKVQAVIGWHPNRFARNAVDSARLIEQMDHGKLIEIITPSQTYRDTPQDKFFFTMLCSQAKMENDSKGIDVKRGLRKKNEMGFPGGVAKLGYINDYGKKGERKIKKDPERFEQVKQLLLMFLSGNHSARALLRYSRDVMGLKTIQRKKEGGKPIQLSRIYAMFRDSFYAGFFYAKDSDSNIIRYEVNEIVPRMITESQYWEIQALLGRKGMQRPSVNLNDFPYKEYSKCGTCGGTITAEHKHQLICTSCKKKFAYKNKDACPDCATKIEKMDCPTRLHYIFYHCTKKKLETCPERSITEDDIDDTLVDRLGNELETSKALSDWCIKNLEAVIEEDRKNEYERRAAWERELAQKEKESEELVRMRMKGLVASDEEFLKHKATLDADTCRIKEVLADMGGVEMAGYEEAKKAFNAIVGVSKVFESGTYEEKKEALSALGSNLTVKDKKLSITNKELLVVISKGLLEARAKNPTFEPRKFGSGEDDPEAFASVRPTLLRTVEAVRTWISVYVGDFYVPKLA